MRLYPWVDAVSRPLMNTVYRVEHLDAERIPSRGPVILAANHESILDPWFLGTITARPVHFFAKAELFRFPMLRQILEGLGGIPVRRGSDMGRAVEAGVAALERGDVLGIFPQGTCVPYHNRRFQRGAARLALATGATLVPVLLVGTERSIQPRTHRIGFPQVTIAVGEPFAVERQEPTRTVAIELTDRLEQAIAELREPYGPPDHAWIDS